MEIESTLFEIHLKPQWIERDTIEAVQVRVNANEFAEFNHDDLDPTDRG